jgi:hypothetical protein
MRRSSPPTERRQILEAQARLGRRDPATTVRHYARASPLDDLDVADQLDRVLSTPST